MISGGHVCLVAAASIAATNRNSADSADTDRTTRGVGQVMWQDSKL